MFLSVVSAVVSASPTPSPSASPVVKLVETVKEVPVVPGFVWVLLLVIGLLALGFVASWVQAFVNSKKDLGEKLNVLFTAGYAIVAPAATAVWQAYQSGQLNLSTFSTATQTAGIVILGAWMARNAPKLVKKTPVYAVDGQDAAV